MTQFTNPLPLHASVCVISARRYGDAIINARIAQAAARSRPDIQWVIWTKPEFAPLFKLMGFDRIITSEFPIAGGTTKFLKECSSSAIKAIIQLRKLNLAASIDFIGDTREALLGCLITGRAHHSPNWDKSHWMSKLIMSTKIPLVNYLPVPALSNRMYQIASDLLTRTLGQNITKLHSDSTISITSKKFLKVGFHPFSSQAFKAWPQVNWQQLSLLLKKNGITPIVFCTGLELHQAHQIFINQNLEIRSSKNLEDLIDGIKSIEMLIGVDSFLVHLASALGKKTIVINSGNDPTWWQPPNSITLGQSGGCLQYPCANQPSCLGSLHESRCIQSITPLQVMAAINCTLPETIPQ